MVIGCSKSSATQRAGRAGRERAGKVYRLCTENDFDLNVAQTSVPEIQRCNLAQPVMLLKSLGIDNLLTFQFLSPPHPPHLARAYEVLFSFYFSNYFSIIIIILIFNIIIYFNQIYNL